MKINQLGDMMYERVTRIISIIAIGSLYSTFLTSFLLLSLSDDINKHILSLVISLGGFSCYFFKNDIIKSGIGLGSALQLAITLGYHWRLYNEVLKIGLYGVALLSLILLTHYSTTPDPTESKKIIGFALGSVYCVFLFTLITYCSEYIHADEFYKRFVLTTASTLTLVGSTTFKYNLRATTIFGLTLGGALLLIMTLYLNWDFYGDLEEVFIFGIPLILSLSFSNDLRMKILSDSCGTTFIISMFIGVLYHIVMSALGKLLIPHYELREFILLALSILTQYITTYMSPYPSKYGLLIGTLMIILVISVSNFHYYTLTQVTTVIGIALAVLLYFASRIEH